MTAGQRSDARSPRFDYWAREEDPDVLAALIMEKVNVYLNSLQRTGRLELWRRSTQFYYGMDGQEGAVRSDQIIYGGEQGELVLMRENHFRNLIVHKHSLVTGTRPSFNAKPNNTDAASLEEAKIAQGIFEYYLDNGGPSDEGIENEAKDAALYAIRYGEGFVCMTWNPSASAGQGPVGVEQVTDPETGEPAVDEDGQPLTRHVFAGDFETMALMPLDVIRDPGHDIAAAPHRWYIVHRRVNRWDLMAEFPDLAEEIANVSSIPNVSVDIFTREEFESEDTISMYELWHRRTPAMPEGRYAAIVGETLVLDGPLPYERVPVMAMVPDPELRTAHGYADAFDLMALQEVVDSCMSTAVTNNDAGGTMNVWTPPGSDLTLKELQEGLTWWESQEKPESIVLAEVGDVTWKLREAAIESMQKLSGINDVARGEPDPGMSGAMAALIHSMAVQSNSSLQYAYGRLLEDMANHMLDIVRRHMDHARVVGIAGFKARTYELSKESLPGSVRRITVELGSALQRNMSGRQELANKFVEMQQIQSPDQYMQVIATGRFEPVTEGPEALYRGIQDENEALVRNAYIQVIRTDKHMEHIEGHQALLRDPAMRTEETREIQERVLGHILEHIAQWKAASADQENGWPLLLATGQQPLPGYGQGPAGAPEQGPGGQGGPQLNPEAAGGVPPMAGPPMETGVSGVDGQVRGPSMPTNPADGQPYDPATQAGPV